MSEIETIKCGFVNCFVIKGAAGSILVDTGERKYREYLLDRIKNCNIKLIILTHGHIDHAGNAGFLAEKLKAQLTMNEVDYKLAKDNTLRPLYWRGLLGFIFRKLSERSLHENIEEFEPDFYVDEGFSLNEYGIDGKVINLKGHTNGSIGVIVDDDKAIVGDAMINIIKPSNAIMAENFAEADKTFNMLQKLMLSEIYVGHGECIKNKMVLEKVNV